MPAVGPQMTTLAIVVWLWEEGRWSVVAAY